MIEESIECGEHIDLLLIERSSTANRVFASIMHDNGSLNDCEWWMYCHLFSYFDSKCNYVLDGILYLNCPVTVAMQRISERNRKGETNVTEEYQDRLKLKHDQWLMDSDLNVPLMEVAVPYDDSTKSEELTIKQIEQFIVGLKPKNTISSDSNSINRHYQMLSRGHKL